MLIKDVMDKAAAVCVPFDTAQSAATIMKRNDIGFIPVVENEPTHMYVGAITDRLLCLRIVGEGLDSAKNPAFGGMRQLPKNLFAAPMIRLRKLSKTMKRKRLDALAVVDRCRNVVGVVLLDSISQTEAVHDKAHSQSLCRIRRKGVRLPRLRTLATR